MKPTPDQLHRLIDEVAELVDNWNISIWLACDRAGCGWWWNERGSAAFSFGIRKSGGDDDYYAGLSAVLILLSEGG